VLTAAPACLKQPTQSSLSDSAATAFVSHCGAAPAALVAAAPATADGALQLAGPLGVVVPPLEAVGRPLGEGHPLGVGGPLEVEVPPVASGLAGWLLEEV